MFVTTAFSSIEIYLFVFFCLFSTCFVFFWYFFFFYCLSKSESAASKLSLDLLQFVRFIKDVRTDSAVVSASHRYSGILCVSMPCKPPSDGSVASTSSCLFFFCLFSTCFVFFCYFFLFYCLSKSELAASKLSLDLLQFVRFINDSRTGSSVVSASHRYSGISVCFPMPCKPPSDGSVASTSSCLFVFLFVFNLFCIFLLFFLFYCLSKSESAASKLSLDMLQFVRFINDSRTGSAVVSASHRYSGISVCFHTLQASRRWFCSIDI